MSHRRPIARVVSLLEASGYRTLERRIAVGGIPFEFDAVLAGETSLDLIVVAATSAETRNDRLRHRIEGLSRALDLVKSRRPLTVVLVGPSPGLALTHALARVSRVLVTGASTGDSADDEARDALAVLLPLRLSTGGEAVESWAGVREALIAAHRGTGIAALFEAAPHGASAVSNALHDMLAASFVGEGL